MDPLIRQHNEDMGAPANMLPKPPDDGIESFRAHVTQATAVGRPIHTLAAMAVASWFHSSARGDAFCAFSHTGRITDGLWGAVTREYDHGYESDVLDALGALRTYVDASTVTVWHVGHNLAGYLPTAEVVHTLDYDNALSTYGDTLREVADSYLSEDACDCDSDVAELCDYHSTEACAHGMYRDDVAPVASDACREISHWINTDAGRVEIWLRAERMTHAAYRNDYA